MATSPLTQQIVGILRDMPDADGVAEAPLQALAERILAEAKLDDAIWVTAELQALAKTSTPAAAGTTSPAASPRGKKAEVVVFAQDLQPSLVPSCLTRESLTPVLESHARWMRSVLEPDALIENGRANLRGADLKGFDLRDVDLRGANLEKADLSGADLSGANFATANLKGARLCGASLLKTVFRRADLSWSDLTGTDLSQADLKQADLRHARRDKEDPIQEVFANAFPDSDAQPSLHAP